MKTYTTIKLAHDTKPQTIFNIIQDDQFLTICIFFYVTLKSLGSFNLLFGKKIILKKLKLKIKKNIFNLL